MGKRAIRRGFATTVGAARRATVRGLSSAGRAPALQAGGHRFDPDRLHHVSIEDEDTPFCVGLWSIQPAGFARFFDIVNGFFNRRGDARSVFAQRGSPC